MLIGRNNQKAYRCHSSRHERDFCFDFKKASRVTTFSDKPIFVFCASSPLTRVFFSSTVPQTCISPRILVGPDKNFDMRTWHNRPSQLGPLFPLLGFCFKIKCSQNSLLITALILYTLNPHLYCPFSL